MNKLKLLILGSAGMAGHIIKNYLSKFPETYDIFDVARSDIFTKPTFLLDVTDFNGLKNLIFSVKPDYIINCIGILNNTAEENPDLAIIINAYLPHFLEKETKNSKCKIIHISTDCVFSGLKGGYVENDIKDGFGFYAQSKALGELNNLKDLTIRTSIVGPELNSSGIGLLHWFLNQNKDIFGYTSAFWSGVTTLELAKFINVVLTRNLSLSGVFHLTNNKKIDKYTLLKLFQSSFEKSDLNINPNGKYIIDKSFINTCKNFIYSVSSYETMINDMRDYIIEHNYQYGYDISNA
jgi:dTDP-4-dehydrorhamnose reductase